MTNQEKKVLFDPKVFLATVNGGRSISKYRTNQKVFSQWRSADAVFYIQKGKVKITVVSEQGKEAVVAVLGQDEFCGEGCLTGQPLRSASAPHAQNRKHSHLLWPFENKQKFARSDL